MVFNHLHLECFCPESKMGDNVLFGMLQLFGFRIVKHLILMGVKSVVATRVASINFGLELNISSVATTNYDTTDQYTMLETS